MKITNQEIIRTARQLRDEDNSQLHVKSWQPRRHFQMPTWLVAVPAAAIIGFLLGLWTKGDADKDVPLTAMTDTIYIETKKVPESTDTTTLPTSRPTPVASKTQRTARPRPTTAGRPISEDKIRYDLLVKN